MKIRIKSLMILSITLFLLVLLGATNVEAVTNPRTMYVFGFTNSVDIATTTAVEVGIGDGNEPAIFKEDFKKIEIKELVRGMSYYLWDTDAYNKIENCTLSVNGVTFGTLEQTNSKLFADVVGDGEICAYVLKVDENAQLPTESSNGKYSISTSIDGWTLLLPSDVTLADKETLQTNTITSNDINSDVKIGITGKISSNAKLVSNEIVETVPEFQMMQTVLTHHLKNNFSQYNNEILFVKEIKIENGNFEGKLTLTFDIGTKYNDKKFVVAHQKSSNDEIEYFDGTIKDGKATIEVTELSPFAIALLTEKAETPNETPSETPKVDNLNKGEKDTTPKTGTIDIIGYVLVVTIISGVGIVVLNKKN